MLWTIFIQGFLFINTVTSEEPKCSRFHYDNQMLEKMIRMEVKFEAMEQVMLKAEKQMAETKEKQGETMNALKSERQEFKQDFTDLKSKITDDVKENKDTLLIPTIAFKARSPVDLSLETGQTVIFTKIMSNHGNGYENTTGIFTAAVGGTYSFSIQLCLHSNKEFRFGIMRDDNVETSGRFYTTSTSCHTADVYLLLEPGQKVWVKCLYGGTTDVLYEQDTSTYNYWNTFSGVLIHK